MMSFSREFQTTGEVLKRGHFNAANSKLIEKLQKFVGVDGPERAHAQAPYLVRELCASGKEANTIISLAGEGAGLGSRVAALKTLRHLYLVIEKGSHSFWMLALPKSFRSWPSDEIKALSGDALIKKLSDVDEYWGEEDRRNLGAATTEGLKWAQKTMIVASGKDAQSDQLVRRWFADENSTPKEIEVYRKVLLEGFKRIAIILGSNKLIMTDNPTLRGKKVEDGPRESDLAYVSASEKLTVIYIEGNFFKNGGSITGLRDWTLTIIHELAHTISTQVDKDGHFHSTTDVAYAPAGLQPSKRSFRSSLATHNADNWAYFCADCAGALSEGERTETLRGR